MSRRCSIYSGVGQNFLCSMLCAVFNENFRTFLLKRRNMPDLYVEVILSDDRHQFIPMKDGIRPPEHDILKIDH